MASLSSPSIPETGRELVKQESYTANYLESIESHGILVRALNAQRGQGRAPRLIKGRMSGEEAGDTSGDKGTDHFAMRGPFSDAIPKAPHSQPFDMPVKKWLLLCIGNCLLGKHILQLDISTCNSDEAVFRAIQLEYNFEKDASTWWHNFVKPASMNFVKV